MFYLFDDTSLLIVIFGMFMAGFLPMLILLMLCPEARQHLKCRITGGLMVLACDDLGAAEYLVAKPKGNEGQYMAGKDRYGQRQVLVKPRMGSGIVSKFFMLTGMRRPIAIWYKGKVTLASPETLAAIEVAEAPMKSLPLPDEFKRWAKDKYPTMLQEFNDASPKKVELQQKILPPEIEAWAKENSITLLETTYEEKPQEVRGPPTDAEPLGRLIGTRKVKFPTGHKEVVHTLFTLDPRKLKHYYSVSYDESQVDNMLERAWIEGYSEGREGKRLHFSKGMMIGIALIAIAVIGIIIFFLAS
jgi:hypothetical protein